MSGHELWSAGVDGGVEQAPNSSGGAVAWSATAAPESLPDAPESLDAPEAPPTPEVLANRTQLLASWGLDDQLAESLTPDRVMASFEHDVCTIDPVAPNALADLEALTARRREQALADASAAEMCVEEEGASVQAQTSADAARSQGDVAAACQAAAVAPPDMMRGPADRTTMKADVEAHVASELADLLCRYEVQKASLDGKLDAQIGSLTTEKTTQLGRVDARAQWHAAQHDQDIGRRQAGHQTQIGKEDAALAGVVETQNAPLTA